MKNRGLKKIRSSQGATMLMALLLMLVGLMVSAVVISAAVSTVAGIRTGEEQQQAYLTVESAAQLFRDTLEGSGGKYEILTVKDGKVTLKHTPIKTNNVSTLKYVYAIVSGEIGTTYVAGTKDPRKDTAESGGDITTFLIADGTEGDVGHAVITLPKSVSDGDKVYVEYQYETEQAIEIVNKASEFPKACSLVIYANFRDKCDENTV